MRGLQNVPGLYMPVGLSDFFNGAIAKILFQHHFLTWKYIFSFATRELQNIYIYSCKSLLTFNLSLLTYN